MDVRVGRDQVERLQRQRESRRRLHLVRVDPEARERVDRRERVELANLAVEALRLVQLVADDAVAGAPPELERDARARDPARVGDRAAPREGRPRRLRRPADLLARESLERAPEVAGPPEALRADTAATELREGAVLAREVRYGIEDRGACEQPRVARDEQQRLLAAHAAAEGVDPRPVDLEPRQRRSHDLRHSREILDLPRVAPRERPEPPALPVGVDDGEVAER